MVDLNQKLIPSDSAKTDSEDCIRQAIKGAPKVTPRKFVFPWDHEKEKFDFSKFCQVKAGAAITEKDLKQVGSDLKSSKYYYTDHFASYFWYFFTPWAAFLLYCVGVYYFIYEIKDLNLKMELVGAGILLLCAALGLCWVGKRKFRRTMERRESSFRKILKTLSFQEKDVYVSVGKYGSYLVFELDFKSSIQGGIEQRDRKLSSTSINAEMDFGFRRGGMRSYSEDNFRVDFGNKASKDSKDRKGTDFC